MKFVSLFIFLSVLFAFCSASCDVCLASDESVLLDMTLTPNGVVSSVIPALQRLCEVSFVTKQESEECMETAVQYILDVYGDMKSESEHVNEQKTLTTAQLCNIVSSCSVRCCITDYSPEQIHLAITDDPTEMIVSWVTYHQLHDAQVDFWEILDNTTSITIHRVEPSISTYKAGGWEGTIYHAKLENLAPGGSYFYRIGGTGDNLPIRTVEHHFTTDILPSSEPLTARSLAAKQDPFVPGVSASVIAFFGDMSTSSNAYQTTVSLINLSVNRTIQAVVQGGDFSYADGDESVWDQYMRMTSSWASLVPWMTAPGNHEDYYLFDSYNHRFLMPWEQSGSSSKQYYSFNYEKIHFVSWSVEEFDGVDLRPEGKQRQWLEADLAQANLERDIRPWVVLFGHRPFYCSSDSNDCTDVASDLRFLLEDVINDYHIDVVLQAHKHNYERTYPVYQSITLSTDYTDPTGPMYYVVGTGGRDKNEDFQSNPQDWSADRDDKYGYLLMSAPDQYSLEMVYTSKSYNVHDSATITRTENITDWNFHNSFY